MAIDYNCKNDLQYLPCPINKTKTNCNFTDFICNEHWKFKPYNLTSNTSFNSESLKEENLLFSEKRITSLLVEKLMKTSSKVACY